MRIWKATVFVLLLTGCVQERPLCTYTERTGIERCVEFMNCGECDECIDYGGDVRQWPFVVEACEEGQPVEGPPLRD